MSTDREVTRIVRSWLDEGATALPDRVLDAVLDRVPATPQRRLWWPARRLPEMNTPIRIAVAASAVIVVALVGINLLPRNEGVGSAPSPTPSPTASPTPTRAPTPSPTPESNLNFTGEYVAGTTYAIEDGCCVYASRMTFTIPASGWYAPLEAWRIGKTITGGSNTFDLYVTPRIVGNVYTGGCHWRGTELAPPIGPTVDDLANALFAQGGPDASPPTAVTVGGYAGKKVETAVPEDLDVTTCDSDGSYPIFGRFVSDAGFGAQPYTHANGQHNTFYIVDVDGKRQVIDAMWLPGASAADLAELEQLVASITFESSPASPSPTP